MASGEKPVIDVRDLRKVYHVGSVDVVAIDSVTLHVDHGEFTAIMGHSGSGKSTFMNLIGCLDRPTAGEYFLEGQNVSQMSTDELAAVRNRHIGFVFQGFNLLARTTALENVELPMLYAGVDPQERRTRALAALDMVGLSGRADHTPAELSGGQQQRVAIARALVNNPSIILADEPTGNLDTRSSEDIMRVFQALNQEHRITVLIVTHEPDIAGWTRRVITFRDGRVVDDKTVQPKAKVPA
ncbi:MAG: ABC transporter ATP-binding protein [Candidatus Eremiobacteraeota bacterium]|nr:ABC transporter ATP-binding protein [Candidatus Eremiobacteraeota bacterium]MBV8365120.1 ABC transporter ATP-binding protein [Candidatus Eremiobacteraeota bacterium]